MYDIDWTKIRNDSIGFEELAREYVKDVFSFPYGKWQETLLHMMVTKMHIRLL